MSMRLMPNRDTRLLKRSDLAVVILGYLALKQYQKLGASHFALLELESMIFPVQSDGEFEFAAKWLEERSLISVVSENEYQFSDSEMKITINGLKLVFRHKREVIYLFEYHVGDFQAEIEELFDFDENYFGEPEEWLFDEIDTSSAKTEEQTISEFLAPAADRVVNKLDNQEAWDQAVSALDDAIEAVRGDNAYGSKDPEDKDQRLRLLEMSRTFFESSKVAVNLLSDVLLGTLEYLAKIGVATVKVTAAIAAVQVLLGG